MFTKDAVIAVHRWSGGIPRTISVLCDNSMLVGFGAEKKPIGPDVVEEVSRDFRLHGNGNGNGNGHRVLGEADMDSPWKLDGRNEDAGAGRPGARPDVAGSRS